MDGQIHTVAQATVSGRGAPSDSQIGNSTIRDAAEFQIQTERSDSVAVVRRRASYGANTKKGAATRLTNESTTDPSYL